MKQLFANCKELAKLRSQNPLATVAYAHIHWLEDQISIVELHCDQIQVQVVIVGSRSQAGCLKRNTAMDDSIGGP